MQRVTSRAAEFHNNAMLAEIANGTSALRLADGSSRTITRKFADKYNDGHTSDNIPVTAMKTAIAEEVAYVNERCCAGVGIPADKADAAGELPNGRWGFCSKSDLGTPECKACYVA